MSNLQVIKTTQQTEPFDPQRIVYAIQRATRDTDTPLTDTEVANITQTIVEQIKKMNATQLTVDDIHDYVLTVLRPIHFPTATAYADYRKMRKNAREYAKAMDRSINYAQHVFYDHTSPIDDETMRNYERGLNRILFKIINKHGITQPVAVINMAYQEINKDIDNYLLTYFHAEQLDILLNKINILNELNETIGNTHIPTGFTSEHVKVLTQQRRRFVDFCIDALLVRIEDNAWTPLSLDLVYLMNQGYPLHLLIDYTITHTDVIDHDDTELPALFHMSIYGIKQQHETNQEHE